MAGGSPVLIASSPPTVVSITSRSSNTPQPSSPSSHLPSPSSFLPPRRVGARRDFLTESPHFNVASAFKSAAKAHEEQAIAKAQTQSTVGREGSLSPERRKGNDGLRAVEINVESQQRESGNNDAPSRESYDARGNALDIACDKPQALRFPNAVEHNGQIDAVPTHEAPGVVSDHTIAGMSDSLINHTFQPPANPAPPAKEPSRSKTIKPRSSKVAKNSSKPARKRFTKSVSIIINSDDPDEQQQNDNSAPVLAPARPDGWSAMVSEEVRQPVADQNANQISSKDSIVESHSPVRLRRRSWTPVKNTDIAAAQSEQQKDANDGRSVSPASPDPQQSLAALVSRFNHSEERDDIKPLERVANGEAMTKRRRVSTEKPLVAKVTKAKPVRERKSEKKPRVKAVKGPRTITALATLAYQPQPQQVVASAVLSELFAPTSNHPDNKPETPAASKAERPRKQAKASSSKSTKSKKTSIAKGPKGLLPFACETPLLPPSQARAHEGEQEFLFGTSSQLAIDEPPEFIKDIQHAINDSEVPLASQTLVSPFHRSCAKVPTAPHGTLLSVGQADKYLWCSSARDENGSVLGRETRSSTGLAEPVHRNSEPKLSGHAGRGDVALGGFERETLDGSPSSPDIPLIGERPTVEVNAKMVIDGGLLDSPSSKSDLSDSWMLLQSDFSVVDLKHATNVVTQAPISPQTQSQSLSQNFSSKRRVALQALDANASLTNTCSPLQPKFTQQRHLSTAASNAAPTLTPPAKARGRPRKAEVVTADAVPPKKRGRPKKQATTTAPSEPVSSTLPSSFKDIDEISDSDVPPTPSPPRRRRATSASPSLQPLDIRSEAMPDLTAPEVIAPVLTPENGSWPSIQKTIFPRISATIKSAPRSDDMKKPSWHEKILLYDPIVLEDLTAWLNEQGIRYEFCKLKARSKSKGGKKKKESATDDSAEYETCTEMLKPWMVQKWCEEKSVCCLWREGLRGGVRTRY